MGVGRAAKHGWDKPEALLSVLVGKEAEVGGVRWK